MAQRKVQGLFGLALASALTLAACGGSTHPGSTTGSTNSSTSTPAVTVAPAHKVKTLTVGARAQSAPTFVPTISARPGEKVAFRAVLPETPGIATQQVVLAVATGPSSTLTITGSAGSQTSSAKITSASGSPITLVHLSYSCDLPPHSTFCPAQTITAGAGSTRLAFIASHRAPVEISAVVGPVRLTAARTVAPGSTAAPPYTVAELLRARTPGASAPAIAPKPQSTVTATPGQVVTMYSHLKSHIHGARQAVTVTISSGPATSLTVTASVPGGAISTATIRSATGTPISLVKARYDCLVAPLAGFCPATHVGRTARGYTLTFMAAPGTPEVEVSANVQAG